MAVGGIQIILFTQQNHSISWLNFIHAIKRTELLLFYIYINTHLCHILFLKIIEPSSLRYKLKKMCELDHQSQNRNFRFPFACYNDNRWHVDKWFSLYRLRPAMTYQARVICDIVIGSLGNNGCNIRNMDYDFIACWGRRADGFLPPGLMSNLFFHIGKMVEEAWSTSEPGGLRLKAGYVVTTA